MLIPKSNVPPKTSNTSDDDWAPVEETFDELSADEALTRVLEDMGIFDVHEPKFIERVQRVRALWANLNTLIIEKDVDSAIAAARRILIDSGQREETDEFLEADLIMIARKLIYAIPNDLQEDSSLQKIAIRRSTIPSPFIDREAVFLDLQKRYNPNADDKRILRELRALDSTLKSGEPTQEERKESCAELGELVPERFKFWMKARSAHPYLSKHAFLSGSILAEAYASYDAAPTSLKDLVNEELESFTERIALLSMLTSPDTFLYCPTIFKWFLLYLKDIGYSTWSEDDLRCIDELQEEYELSAIDANGYDGHISRTKLIAADLHGISYWDYFRNEGNLHYDRILPRSVDILRAGGETGWDDSTLAKYLSIEVSAVPGYRERYLTAVKLAKARNQAETFRLSITTLLTQAIDGGLNTDEKRKELVNQICHRASDLLYLIERTDELLEDVAHDLREAESSVIETSSEGPTAVQ